MPGVRVELFFAGRIHSIRTALCVRPRRKDFPHILNAELTSGKNSTTRHLSVLLSENEIQNIYPAWNENVNVDELPSDWRRNVPLRVT
jgi:hypothetical protein